MRGRGRSIVAERSSDGTERRTDNLRNVNDGSAFDRDWSRHGTVAALNQRREQTSRLMPQHTLAPGPFESAGRYSHGLSERPVQTDGDRAVARQVPLARSSPMLLAAALRSVCGHSCAHGSDEQALYARRTLPMPSPSPVPGRAAWRTSSSATAWSLRRAGSGKASSATQTGALAHRRSPSTGNSRCRHISAPLAEAVVFTVELEARGGTRAMPDSPPAMPRQRHAVQGCTEGGSCTRPTVVKSC